MELTEDIRQKVTIKIEKLKADVNNFCSRLQDIQDCYRATWEGFGKEPCTVEMANEESGLQRIINYSGRQIRMLEDYLDGHIDIIADEERFKSRALEVEDNLTKLQMKKLDLEDCLRLIAEVKKDIFD